MKEGKPQSWKITVDARAKKKFRFKFRASKMEPTTWSFLRFSIWIKLRQLLLNVKAESGTSIPKRKPRTLKSKFRRFFQKFSAPPTEKRAIAAKKTPNPNHSESPFLSDKLRQLHFKEPLCVGSLLIGALAWLSESVSAKDQEGIVIGGLLSVFFLFVALLFERYMNGKSRSFWVFLTIATIVCAAVFCLDNYMNLSNGAYISELVWKACNYAASFGCLYVLSQVMCSTFCEYLTGSLGPQKIGATGHDS